MRLKSRDPPKLCASWDSAIRRVSRQTRVVVSTIHDTPGQPIATANRQRRQEPEDRE